MGRPAKPIDEMTSSSSKSRIYRNIQKLPKVNYETVYKFAFNEGKKQGQGNIMSNHKLPKPIRTGVEIWEKHPYNRSAERLIEDLVDTVNDLIAYLKDLEGNSD